MRDSNATTNAVHRSDPGVAGHQTGLSAVELAASRGIGPMSSSGREVWHGGARPCPSCGELVRRTDAACLQCGQDLSEEMIAKMIRHCGPWYVHEHVRPFPGVTLERLIRQARRGILTATTIVRGPTTYHQWRFAAETPALSKHLGLCWNCGGRVTPNDTYCQSCDVHLDRPPGELPIEAPRPSEQEDSELARLSMALRSTNGSTQAPSRTRAVEGRNRGRRAGTSLVIAAIIVLTVSALLVAVKLRTQPRSQSIRTDAPLAGTTQRSSDAHAGS